MTSFREEIRLRLIHEFEKGTKPAEAYQILRQIFGEEAPTRMTCYNRYHEYLQGNRQLKNKPGQGRPHAMKNEEFQQFLQKHPGHSAHQMAAELGHAKSTILKYLNEIDYIYQKQQKIPSDLTDEDRERRVAACGDMLTRLEMNPTMLEQIITCDEKWLLLDNRQPEGQWVPRGTTPETVPGKGHHPAKVLLCIWWCSTGVLFCGIVPEGTIDAVMYEDQVEEVQQKLRSPGPFTKISRRGPLLIHDGATPHSATLTRNKLEELGWAELPLPPRSPDIAPTDYHFNSALSQYLKGKRFNDEHDTLAAVEAFIQSKEGTDFFKRGIEALPKRWQMIIDTNGNYIVD
jgi:histone-lysine N-methyltransferase SETMAR